MFYFFPTSYQLVALAAINRCKAYIRGLSELGVETAVVCYGDEKAYAEEKLPNIKYEIFRNPFRNKWLSYIPQTLYVIWLLLKLRKGDTCYFYGGTWLWYQVLRWKKGVKVYVEFTEKPEIVGLGGKFLTPSYEKFYKACPKLSGMFVISTALRDWFVSKGVPQEKMNIINVIVDSTRFEGLTRQPSERYIAYCGTASNNKDGVDMLIKAFAITSKSHPDVKLYIMGKTPDPNQAFENGELVKRLGIADKVVFTGPVPMERMPQMLRNAEVCALARPDNEQARFGFATKMGEYLLSGNPVVVTAVGDFPLFLKDGDSALLVEPGNVEDFAAKLSWALDNPDEAKQIGTRGAEVALRSFNYFNETQKMAKIMSLC